MSTVSERQASTSPSESEVNLQWALEAARVGTWTNDLVARHVAWSPELYEIFGLEPHQFHGTEDEFFNLIHPEDQPEVARIVTRAKAEVGEYEVEFRFHKGEELRWMFARGKAYADPTGQAHRLAGIGIDITDHKLANMRLEALHELSAELIRATSLANIFEAAMTCLQKALGADRSSILLFDPDGVMRFKASRGLSDRYRKSVEGHSPWTADAVHPEPITMASVAKADLGELKDTIYGEGIRSLGFFPLSASDRLIGKFMVYFDREHEFSRQEVELAQVIAGHIAVAVERRRNEEAVRASEENLRITADSLSAPVARCSKDLKFIWVSKAYGEWIGKSPGEIAGKPIPSVIGQAAANAILPFINRVLAGESFSYEAHVPYEALGYRWIEAHYNPTYNAEGQVDGWVAIIIDLAERKKSEETIRTLMRVAERLSSTLELDELLDHLVDASLQLVDAESGVAGLFTPQGMVCKKYFQRGRAIPLDYCWPPGHGLPGWVSEHKVPYLTNDAMNDPVIVHSLCEQFGVASALCTPILGADNALLGFFELHNKRSGKGFDESDRDLLLAVSHAAAISIQNAMAYRQIREADQKKDEFLATLAHELRNPLAPIRNAISLLQKKGTSDPEVQQLRDIIDRQATQLSRLVDDLMDVSRITRGRVQLLQERVKLREVLLNAMETVKPLVDSSEQTLVANVPSETIAVHGDFVRLSQVVSNLLHNASKFTPRGGKIEVSISEVNDKAVITVADNGVGIQPERLPRLFDMFSQDVPALNRSQGGLGIGLALVKGLVGLHGGTIEARSEGPGSGSEFRIFLPLSPKAPLEVAKRWSEKPGPDERLKRRILIVDDNVDHAFSLSRLLEMNGHETHTAHDGESAVAAAAEVRPDIILLDIGLPKMNGYECAERIRRQEWSSHTLIVALTGWGQDEDKRKAQAAGFNHHLTKPVDIGVLAKLIETVGTGSRGV